jgi:hypothetical protein
MLMLHFSIRRSARMLLILAVTAQVCRFAEASGTQADVGASSSQPTGSVTRTLRIPDGRRQFRLGEIVPIEVVFSSSVPKRFVVDGATDRSGRPTIDDFRIEPAGAVVDPLLDYFADGGPSIGGGLRAMGLLGEKPFTVKLHLNEWLRFVRPGNPGAGAVRLGRVATSAARTVRVVACHVAGS